MGSEAIATQAAIEQHKHESRSQFYWVWVALLVISGLEVFLAYEQLQPVRMLSILLGLSIIKSALIILWFMHLKFEVARMRRIMMVALCVCLALMCVFFADAFRVISLGVH